MTLAILSVTALPVIIGYLFSLREDASSHKHFQRVTELNG